MFEAPRFCGRVLVEAAVLGDLAGGPVAARDRQGPGTCPNNMIEKRGADYQSILGSDALADAPLCRARPPASSLIFDYSDL